MKISEFLVELDSIEQTVEGNLDNPVIATKAYNKLLEAINDYDETLGFNDYIASFSFGSDLFEDTVQIIHDIDMTADDEKERFADITQQAYILNQFRLDEDLMDIFVQLNDYYDIVAIDGYDIQNLVTEIQENAKANIK